MAQGLFGRVSAAYQNYFIRTAHLGAVALGTQPLTNVYFGNPLYHLSGFVSGATGLALDHISTIPVIRAFNKPEFRERGLNEIYGESSVVLGKHPTMQQYVRRSILIDLFVLGASSFFPTVGYAYLSISPMLNRNNRDISQKIEASLESRIERT